MEFCWFIEGAIHLVIVTSTNYDLVNHPLLLQDGLKFGKKLKKRAIAVENHRGTQQRGNLSSNPLLEIVCRSSSITFRANA